jgi:hypothetical protein
MTNKTQNEKEKKASDSDENQEPEEEVFTKEDFEDALKRVSRVICEPDEENS